MNNQYYRAEIDGLRAVSVLVIILFHLKVSAFSGGFIGVDVFFVVSGYLITQIIVSSLGAGNFSFRDFYLRRIARILPALIATILVVLPVAMYLQQPAALIHTAQESIYALLSLSNIFFWTEANYWAPSAEKYVLLHTWSLGVEEQFYLVYPLLLVASHRIAGVRGVVTLLLLIFIGGALASEAVLKADRSAAFYFTPLRFYEFALGGLAATMPGLKNLQKTRESATTATVLGLGLILYAAIEYHGTMALPGFDMLLPLSGAVLILLAGPNPVARLLLMNPLMSYLGKISYSLYLTHWPIVVFYRYYFGANLSAREQVALFAVILVASTLLNRGVERRFRLSHDGSATAGGTSSRTVLLAVAATTSTAILICIATISAKGWPSRMPEEARAMLEINPMADMIRRAKFLEKNCTPRGEIFCGERQAGKTNILLLGDSRAVDIYIALKNAYPDANIRTSYAMGCPPVFSPLISRLSPFFKDCPEFNEARLQAALDTPKDDIIFLAQQVEGWRIEAIRETVERLRKAGKTVYLLGEFTIVEHTTPIEIAIDLQRFTPYAGNLDKYLVAEPFKFDGEFAEQVNSLGAVYISYRDFFFDGEYHLEDRKTGELLTYDGLHLNQYGAKRFGRYLRDNYPLRQGDMNSVTDPN